MYNLRACHSASNHQGLSFRIVYHIHLIGSKGLPTDQEPAPEKRNQTHPSLEEVEFDEIAATWRFLKQYSPGLLPFLAILFLASDMHLEAREEFDLFCIHESFQKMRRLRDLCGDCLLAWIAESFQSTCQLHGH